MNFPKCGCVLEPDEVLMEESYGTIEQYYCDICDIWLNSNGRILKHGH